MSVTLLTTNMIDLHLGGKRRVPTCVWVSGDHGYLPSITAKQEQLDL